MLYYSIRIYNKVTRVIIIALLIFKVHFQLFFSICAQHGKMLAILAVGRKVFN